MAAENSTNGPFSTRAVSRPFKVGKPGKLRPTSGACLSGFGVASLARFLVSLSLVNEPALLAHRLAAAGPTMDVSS
jgi:hypothetical protein